MMKRIWYTFPAVLLAVVLLAGCDANKKPYEEAQGLFSGGSYAEAAEGCWRPDNTHGRLSKRWQRLAMASFCKKQLRRKALWR